MFGLKLNHVIKRGHWGIKAAEGITKAAHAASDGGAGDYREYY